MPDRRPAARRPTSRPAAHRQPSRATARAGHPRRPTRRSRTRHKLKTLLVLVALAAVVTAGAPSIITVKEGDSLWEIARRHDTTISALRALNELPGRGTIYAGDRLRIPAPRLRTVERSHRVRRGETLSAIAGRYGVSTRTLRVRNKLPRSGLVQTGRRLAVPVQVRVGSARGRSQPAIYNAGVRIPTTVRQSAARSRAIVQSRRQPSKAAVQRMVRKTARRHGVDPSLALAVAYHESGFQQAVVSSVDAIGVMQVLPSTGRALERSTGRDLDLLKAQDNITAGVLLLKQLRRSTGSTAMTLAGYYQGLGSVRRRGLLPQTHAYIRNVSFLQQRFGP